jgi:hypothetical protein
MVEMRSKAIRSAFGGLAPHLNHRLQVCYDGTMVKLGNRNNRRNASFAKLSLEISIFTG